MDASSAARTGVLGLRYPYFRFTKGRPRPYDLAVDFTFHTPVKDNLVRSKFYSLDPDGRLRILKGYRWDLGTYAIDDPAMIVASLEHDAFCDMCNAGELDSSVRPLIDAHFRRRLQEYSRSWMGESWSWVRWLAVVSYRRLRVW